MILKQNEPKYENNIEYKNSYPEEDLFPIIADKGNDGILIIQNEKIRFANTRILEMTGFSKKELIGKSLHIITHPKYRDQLIERYKKRLKNEEVPKKYEIAFLSKTGKTIPIEISGNLIEYENEAADMAIISDITDRKKLENKHKQSEAEFEQVVSSINTIVWKADVTDNHNFTNVYISPVADKLIGVESGTIGSDWNKYFSYIHPDDQSEVHATIQREIQKDGVVDNYEYRIIKPDGTISWFSSSGAVGFDAKGTVQIFGTTIDITEKKKAEEKIIESEEVYKQVVSSIDALIWKADVSKDGEFSNTYISPVAKKLLGIENELFLDWDRFLNYIHPDDIQSVMHALKMMTNGHKTSIDYEYRIIRPDGKQLYLYEKGTAGVNSNGTLQIFGSTIDITEKKRVYAMLRSERNKAQNYFDVAKVMMLVLDIDLNIIQINKKGCSIIGYSEEEIIGKNCDIFLTDNFKETIQTMLSSLLKDELKDDNKKSIEYCENPILTRTSEVKIIAWHNSILKDENGNIEGILCSGEDVTLRNETEFNLIKAKTEAEASNRAKNEFIANVSHELRTPLNSVIGFADVMNNESFGPLNDKQKKYTDNILKNGKNLLTIINKVLRLSAIEAKATEIHIESLYLMEIFEKVHEELHDTSRKKDVCIKNNIDSMLRIDADEEKLTQILLELIENSIKFTEPNGSIMIDAKEEDKSVHITVSDTGIGIPKNELEKMFNHFYQVDSSSTRKYGGNGIGLSLVKYYIGMHDGKLWVDSKEGEGTSIHVTLPLKNK